MTTHKKTSYSSPVFSSFNLKVERGFDVSEDVNAGITDPVEDEGTWDIWK